MSGFNRFATDAVPTVFSFTAYLMALIHLKANAKSVSNMPGYHTQSIF
jgi:hypothetical protein